MAKFLEIDVGCDEAGRRRAFQVECDGRPWAGFDTYEEAEAARAMWQNQPRKNKHEFTHGAR